MSSDEEVDDGFLSHPYSWESEEWRRIKDSLDKKFLETCPPRSKRLLAKRTRGSVREQEPPKVDITHSWVIDESKLRTIFLHVLKKVFKNENK